MGAVLPGTPAEAASTITCTGFSACGAKARSDAGYGRVLQQSFWNMSAGHNCTNYVAYRLTHGRMTARPPGTGSAGTWADAARAAKIPVNARPVVGAVAWWSKDAVKAGYTGHVAYVEKVYADGSIDVSEDNSGGDFRWRHLTAGSGWPTSFIHYPASDGSPMGRFDSVTADVAGQLDFRGTSGEPDAGSGVPAYLVTLGGPRGTAGVESFTFSTEYYSFSRTKTVKTRGATTMYLYALNTVGTGGRDVLLGSRPVTIRDASDVDAATTTTKQWVTAKIVAKKTRAWVTFDVKAAGFPVSNGSFRIGSNGTWYPAKVVDGRVNLQLGAYASTGTKTIKGEFLGAPGAKPSAVQFTVKVVAR